MHIVIFSIILNQHQVAVADELWKQTNHRFAFVELENIGDTKGGTEDYSTRPYLLQVWKNPDAKRQAFEWAISAEVCVFSGIRSLPFQRARLKKGLLSFEMSERWLKQGWKNLLSPRLLKNLWNYHIGYWSRKPLYKLCCSAFCAHDQYVLHTFKNKCYKWGYFIKVDKIVIQENSSWSFEKRQALLMWCSRYLKWKHPELPIMMAARLKNEGYRFVLDMYGCGEYEEHAKSLVRDLSVDDIVHFVGTKPNNELLKDMRQHDIFLFTSDQNEGWGAVANESMSNGCILVASDAIGSVPYLVKNEETGILFHSPKSSSGFDNPDLMSLDDLCAKVKNLLDNPSLMKRISRQGITQMQEVWSPQVAVYRLLTLIDCLRQGNDTVFDDGPCSKA
uniref:glycosyltransferase family 4 protein n=1 Tax=Alistipes megaguti TaxID=2364787 RepID=UPI000EFC67C0|nr:glycosyltransferase [Alistipes megaguti]